MMASFRAPFSVSSGFRSRAARVALVIATAAIATGAAFGVGCATSASPPPAPPPPACTLQVVGMTVLASPKINPEVDGQPRPVQLRLYQLKTDNRLLNASFDQIWKDDKATLQDDLVKVDEFPVYPDTRTEVKFERDASALFVVAVALFRNPKGRSWWTEFELPPPPGKGNCQFANPKCTGPDCQDGGPQLAPHFALWIDDARIDDGSDHLDDYPDATRIRQLYLHFSAAPGQPAAGPQIPATPSAPEAPAAPAAPALPSGGGSLP